MVVALSNHPWSAELFGDIPKSAYSALSVDSQLIE